MPRLRNTNIVISNVSEIVPGDHLVFRSPLFDIVGIAAVSMLGEICIEVNEDRHILRYVITEERILCRSVIKISAQAFDRLKAEQVQYYRENDDLEGYRTGLFDA